MPITVPIRCVDCNKELGGMATYHNVTQAQAEAAAKCYLCEDCAKARQEAAQPPPENP